MQSGLDFGEADPNADGLENGMALSVVGGSGGSGDGARRKSRIVVCKNCGGNHYKKTACRPQTNVEV